MNSSICFSRAFRLRCQRHRKRGCVSIRSVTEHQESHTLAAGHNLGFGARTDRNQNATVHRVRLALCVKGPAALKRNIKLLFIVRSVVVLRIMLPVWRHPDSIHTKFGEAEALTRKEEILTLLKRTSVTFHLVEILDCYVWHTCFGNGLFRTACA